MQQLLSVLGRVVSAPVRIGIATALAVAFASVALLVLAANFTVEQGVMIERTTEITHTVPVMASVPPPVRQIVSTPVAPVVAPRVVSSERLSLSVDRFGRSALDRAEDGSDRNSIEFQRSTTELDHAASIYLSQVYELSGKSLPKVSSAIKSYQQKGSELVETADQRRAALSEYDSVIEGMNIRIKASLNGAWKILGRVVARQSLLQLSANLDRLRQSSASLRSMAPLNESETATVLKDEQTFISSLESNAASFRRSEGDNWYVAMHEYAQRLVVARESTIELGQTLHALISEFSQASTSIGSIIPAKVDEPAERVAARTRARARAAAPSAQLAPVAAPVADQEPAPPVVETHSVTLPSEQDRATRVKFAYVSAGVLLLLFYISVTTVMSIVRPVRRLIRASARLASGDNAVRVKRGGMKELDALALAFNSMADELATAKAAAVEYRSGLEAKVAERTYQLQHLAENDPLTGLPNRRELFSLLNAAMDRARSSRQLLGVFFLDIDNFKYINDSMGHAFGDRVLISLAERLREVTASLGFSARLGGDEFTVVCENAASVEEIRWSGLAVVQAFQAPLTVDGRDLIVSISLGASIFPEHEQSAEALLKAADAALFRAKALGRNQLSMFTHELLEAAASKFTIEQSLRKAVERGEFELLFQPEIGVASLETELVEALIRWRMPDGTLIPPAQFLAVAEESGLIMEISDWVLEAAIEAAAHWHHGAWPDARVAINVSPRQLLDHHFGTRLQSLLQLHNLPARCIEIELTETVLQTGPATLEALQQLAASGIAIALDDFGTGYSSLSSLEQLPLTRIKLDRSLIASIDTSARSAAIAGAIISMCEGLGLQITAEGVERPEQFAMLAGHQTMSLQGYLFSAAVARDELIPTMSRVAQRCRELVLENGAHSCSPAPAQRLAGVEEQVRQQAS